MNNLEGFLNTNYIRLYDSTHLEHLNEEYGSNKYIPGFTIIGSIDGEALCIDQNNAVYRIPFIPLRSDHAKKLETDLEELKKSAGTEMQITDTTYELYGKELHFIKPVVFGGSPTDPANRKYVTQSEHIELCDFWNSKYSELT